ncbi:hypothetical protein P691DRAFT_775095 [Macrolepiota fuliginosa MF-IS2]|uniref:F-box domain-containing protein n=1 Tax=Macrolepiota fuliginosa MF-IS2 TaxID=1400762 RepID=A0A9P6C4Z1_9AGAR|nr:hypothetical protein P691DRAFT_775095 [Macrolepiota fuliginosa MF-IS2]
MVSRRSERNTNKPTLLYEQDNSEDATLTEDDTPTELHEGSRSSKRRRVVRNPATPSTESKNAVQREPQTGRPDRGHVKGRRGHLKQMTEMPLDTLHEIFRDLEPIDLLHLSWASKSLHAIVMEKSARYIWEGAFERLYTLNKPPPRCPEDLNLAQYTRFIFKKQCMVCGIANGHWTSWNMRLRVCWKCLTSSDRFMRYDDHVVRYKTYLLSIRARGTYFCFKADYLEVSGLSGGRTPYGSFSTRKDARTRGGKAYEEWTRNCSDVRAEVLTRRRLERKTAILNNLAEIGWKESEIEEVTNGNVLDNLESCTRVKKLTGGEWKELQPRIVRHLQVLKDARMKVKRKKRWEAFCAQFLLWAKDQTIEPFWKPRAVDLAILEPFRSIIFTPSLGDGDFPLDKIDYVAREWMRSRDDFVLSVLPQDIQVTLRKESKHNANTTLMQPLAFLQFRGLCGLKTITHVCGTRYSLQQSDRLDKEIHEVEQDLCDLKCPARPWVWDSRSVEFSTKGSEVAKEVVKLLGLDECTATLSQLEQCKKKFKCLRCTDTDFVLEDWHKMVEHELSGHPGDQTDTPISTRWSEMASEAQVSIGYL